MKNYDKVNKIIRRLSLVALLITVTGQLITIILFETGMESHDVVEVHEFFGFMFFALVLLHLLIFRKGLKMMLFPKNK